MFWKCHTCVYYIKFIAVINTLQCGCGWMRSFQYHYEQLVTIIRILDTVGPWSFWCIYFDYVLPWSALTRYNNNHIYVHGLVYVTGEVLVCDCRPFSSWDILINIITRFLNPKNIIFFQLLLFVTPQLLFIIRARMDQEEKWQCKIIDWN